MNIISVAVILAAAGIAAADHHHHGHAHLHRREPDALTAAAAGPVVYVYELAGNVIPAEKACNGIVEGSLEWANGIAPSGACVTSSAVPSTSSAPPAPTPTDSAAQLFEQSASISSSSSTSSSTSTPPPPPPPTTTSSTSTATSSSTSSTSSTDSPSSSSSSSPAAIVAPSNGASGPGGVTLINKMTQPVYLWSVTNVPADMVTIQPGGTYIENWRINPDGGGVSLKVSTTPNLGNVLQYEYTLSGSTIFWDLSSINMLINNLLSTVGFSVTSDNNNCVADICPAGDLVCAATYLFPADNLATHGCDANTNMVFTIGL